MVGSQTSFIEAWKEIGDEYPLLREFFGTLETPMAGTATVESDFSILRDKKNKFNAKLSDFSLEAKMQARQFKVLAEVTYLYAEDYIDIKGNSSDDDSDSED